MKGCRDLKTVGTLGGTLGVKQDPYCVLTCYQQKFRSNTHTDGGKDPVWNQIFTFEPVSPDISLKLEFFDEKMLFRDKAIGEGKILLRKVFEAPSKTLDMKIPVHTLRGKQQGECTLQLTLKGMGDKKTSNPEMAAGPSAAAANPDVPDSPFRGHLGAATDAAGKAMENKAAVNHAPAPVAAIKKPMLSAPSGHVPSRWLFPAFANTNCWAEYDRGRLLGKGNFGKTYLATHRISRKEFAVKVIPKRRLSTLEEIQDVKNEVDVMYHLAGHPNVVCLEHVYEDRDDVCLVMELMRGGELFDAIAKKGKYTEKDAAALIRNIVNVVAKCHAESVIHRDIKPENFLLTDNTPDAKLKAADFGLSTFFKEAQRCTDHVGSLYYMAPEVLRRDYSKEADIWSCGVILYILLSGSIPFGAGATSEKEAYEAIRSELLDLQSDPWDKISEPAKDCIRRMLKRDPKHRAKAADILNNEWLRENGCASDVAIEVGVVTRMKNFNQGNKLKKAATQMIVSKLPLHEINGLREIFTAIDTRKTGRITLKEFADALKQQGTKLSEAELRKMWKEVDMDGDGTILYEEFLAATINQSKLQREDRMKAAFMRFDIDGDGFIGPEELRQGLRAENITDEGIEDIIRQVDQDGSGTIDYNEFCAMMRAL